MRIAEGLIVPPGEMLVEGDRLFLGCAAETTLELLEVQMEGKRRMPAAEFLRGYQVRSGERLGL
jgi:methionyl-tRNA formyltransferase